MAPPNQCPKPACNYLVPPTVQTLTEWRKCKYEYTLLAPPTPHQEKSIAVCFTTSGEKAKNVEKGKAEFELCLNPIVLFA